MRQTEAVALDGLRRNGLAAYVRERRPGWRQAALNQTEDWVQSSFAAHEAERIQVDLVCQFRSEGCANGKNFDAEDGILNDMWRLVDRTSVQWNPNLMDGWNQCMIWRNQIAPMQ